MTDEAKALVGKLRERAAEVRGYIASCQIVVDLLAPEMQKFNAREAPWDVYTVRMAVDHESSIRTQAKEAEEYEASADLIETQAHEIERLREELMQIEVDAMEYYNDWMEHGCEQVEATRFAFDLGQCARAALGESHDQ